MKKTNPATVLVVNFMMMHDDSDSTVLVFDGMTDVVNVNQLCLEFVRQFFVS